ncbi:MAG TPA: CDP-alcohol phosphatidyltransferase family protein [Alphaproteobacteria bacterium]|nr:CDP-alcohol phosphatidyltransferase family protein [Alphaproteobacteria bacterium]
MINLPNLITLARLLASPLAVYLILNEAWVASFWIFVAAGLSDALDGFLAKRFDARTLVGGYLDPLADKALLVGVFVVLGYLHHLPNWLVILVVFRDLLIVGGAILMHTLTGSLRMRPLMISKINTGAQFVLPAYVLAQLGLGANREGIVVALIYIVAATTVLSGAAYLVSWSRRTADIESAG